MDIIEILVLMVCVGVLLYRKSVQKPSGKSRKASKSRPLHSDSFPSAERAVPHASVSPEMPMKDFTTLHASALKRKQLLLLSRNKMNHRQQSRLQAVMLRKIYASGVRRMCAGHFYTRKYSIGSTTEQILSCMNFVFE